VVPDILANAGGVIVSYLESVQAVKAYGWPSGLADRRLRRTLEETYGHVAARTRAQGLAQRRAACSIARVVEAHERRGFFPMRKAGN
jgi:glutamate dehydrogenase (NAD(P)+)